MNRALPTTDLVDRKQLEIRLVNRSRMIPVLKAELKSAERTLADRFYAGASVEQLVRERAVFMDQILNLTWHRFNWNQNISSWRKTRISLLAVGGYGRRELHPHSDIDLLILLERNTYTLHKQNIQNFLTLLWDIGLEVGHSVRSINECKIQCKSDVTIMTALMESRTIAGSDELRLKMSKRISRRKIWSSEKFYRAKIAEQAKRDEKYDETVYNLEPNVKSSPGGLRDIHMVVWVAKRRFDAEGLDDLMQHGFLTRSESELLSRGRAFLWKIRYGLHILSGRADDRLSFESQRRLAELFGYKDRDDLLAVEQFMQDCYRTCLSLRGLTSLLLQHFEEEILREGERAVIKPLNQRFRIHNDYIEVVADDIFRSFPPALIELFVLMGNHESIEGVRSSTIRLVRNHIYLIDDKFRADPKSTALFMELLKSPHKLSFHMRRMKRYGILGAYLPEFGRIIGQMQFDLFHIYTVDEHTMQVIRNLRLFRYKDNQQRFPVAAHIIPRLPKIELLYIAALYHDIGKGKGGDHSKWGSTCVAEFCQQHNLGKWDSNLVGWLVLNHLVMSVTAQKKDISDPEIVREFALLVQDQVRLDYLYTLTVADITATNPVIWTTWKAALLRQLYLDTKRVLRRGLEYYVDKSEYIADAQTAVIDRLTSKGITEHEILALWDNIGDEYFIRESLADIVWHTEAILKHSLDSGPLVLIKDRYYQQGEEGATQIFMHARNRDYLFAATVTALDQLNLGVQEARIITSAGDLVFNTFVVLDVDGQPVGENQERIAKILAILKEHLSYPEEYSNLVKRRTSRSLKQFNVQTHVTISNDIVTQQTVLEIATPDRAGLLALLGRIFVEFEIVLLNAKITTLGDRVEDVFFICDKNKSPIGDSELCNNLKRAVISELDDHANS
ncbi:MAG: [protein-PII] uridylyltransferase [Pseudomonadales bacterium]|jgi:[protein-PII] uridylyltransferase|nr:[protein-PII] uridylyltransferase [Pseudomonadales bacterium]MDP7357754.1 [protein-PII] uridylyltransferase [Pseudomonadales bacterium]MDP7596199.1 [protein-PII] uridylyltransferase [Pseudomonadales bacterium]HJN50457.1 [protein-PII] uridylyltransferase [Pseudomonadales bacterium]|tara:strand:+ start:1917 stop:4619 length:2703 start_codon:yes stop_codon:yes gene_type:complete